MFRHTLLRVLYALKFRGRDRLIGVIARSFISPSVVDTPEYFAKALMDFAFHEQKRNGAQLSVREIQGSSMNAEKIAQRIDRFLAITQMQMEAVK